MEMHPPKVAAPAAALLPKTAKGWKKRERLRAAARRVFARRGFLEARVSDIAQEAGVSIGNFYQYFRDKDEMLCELLQEFGEELFKSSRAAGAPGDDPYLALEHVTRGLYEVYEKNADLYKVMMQVVQIDPKYTQLWVNMREPFIQRVYRLLTHVPEFQRSGINPKYAATALVNMASQSAYIWIVRRWGLDGETIKLDEAIETITRLWYRAMYGTDPVARTSKPAVRVGRKKVVGAPVPASKMVKTPRAGGRKRK